MLVYCNNCLTYNKYKTKKMLMHIYIYTYVIRKIYQKLDCILNILNYLAKHYVHNHFLIILKLSNFNTSSEYVPKRCIFEMKVYIYTRIYKNRCYIYGDLYRNVKILCQ